MDRYYQSVPSVPGETAESAPFALAIPLENAVLVDIEVVIPSGHRGLTGIRVLQSRQQILPWANLSWITGDAYSRVFAVDAEIGKNSLSVEAFNTDIFAHTFQLRFHLRDLPDDDQGGPSGLAQTVRAILGLRA